MVTQELGRRLNKDGGRKGSGKGVYTSIQGDHGEKGAVLIGLIPIYYWEARTYAGCPSQEELYC